MSRSPEHSLYIKVKVIRTVSIYSSQAHKNIGYIKANVKVTRTVSLSLPLHTYTELCYTELNRPTNALVIEWEFYELVSWVFIESNEVHFSRDFSRPMRQTMTKIKC